MKKKKLFAVAVLLLSALYGYGQIKSGIIVGGGKGSLSNVVFPDEYTTLSGIYIEDLQWSYKYLFDAAIGYKFRLEPQNKPFFYDLDLNIGLKRFNTGLIGTFETEIPMEDSNEEEIEYYRGNSYGHFQQIYYSFSVNPTWNYRLLKGLYAGVGIEPTLYFIDSADLSGEEWKFDLPLTAKIGYDLKFIDFSIHYKHGLFDTMDPMYLGPAKFRNWQLSVFIPF